MQGTHIKEGAASVNFLQRTGLMMALALGATLAAPAQQVITDYDHSVQFSQYHTYSWGHLHCSDPLYEPRIKDAVDQALQSKGWRLVPDGGDVMVSAVAILKHQKEYTTFYDGFGGGWRWHGWGPGWATTDVEEVPVGSLVVDLYDTAGKGLIWRGVARSTLSDKPEKDTEKMRKAVEKMFSHFPPSST
jgi:hypothetical protein